jgi:hypothetical protein
MSIEPTRSRSITKDAEAIEHAEHTELPKGVSQAEVDIYDEALAKYGVEGDIDPAAEKRVRRKLDMRIIPM